MFNLPLLDGGFAQVDDIDSDLKCFTWRRTHKGAVQSSSRIDGAHLYLSRIIAKRMGLNLSYLIDHEDRDKLNNQRQNLRESTNGLNRANSKINRNNKLGVKGVHLKGNSYYAQINVNGKKIFLGNYVLLEDAKEAYNDAAKHYFGEFACVGSG